MPILLNTSILEKIADLERTVEKLNAKVEELEQSLAETQSLDKFQLLRVKNKEELSDDYILKSQTYLDLTPEKAFELYSQDNANFMLLDVSKEGYAPFKELPEVIKIQLEDLELSTHLLPGMGKSIFVISENGVRSISACKALNGLGYYNLNNISGGYKFWPGFRKQETQKDEEDYLKPAS